MVCNSDCHKYIYSLSYAYLQSVFSVSYLHLYSLSPLSYLQSPISIASTITFSIFRRVSKLLSQPAWIAFSFGLLHCQFSHSPLVYFGGDISWHSFWAGFFSGPAVCRLCGLLWVTWALPDVLFASVSQSRFNFVHALIPQSASSCFLDNLFIVCTICDNFPPTTTSRILLHFPLQFSSARGESEKRNKAKCKSWHSQFSHVALQIVVSPQSRVDPMDP